MRDLPEAFGASSQPVESRSLPLERPVLSRWVLEMGAVALCDTGRQLLVSRSHSGMTVVDRRAVLALMCGIRFEPASPRLIDLPQINGLDADLVRLIYLRRPRNPLIADSPAMGTDSPHRAWRCDTDVVDCPLAFKIA